MTPKVNGFAKQDVAIVGVGITPSGEHWDKGLRELTIEAGFAAAADAGVRGRDIDLILVGNMSEACS